MSGQFDLEIDTEGIRRAATIVDEAGRRFVSSVDPGSTPAVAPEPLGGSAQAASTVGLINLRVGQAHDAAIALRAVASGLTDGLRRSAERFDAYEAAIRWGTG